MSIVTTGTVFAIPVDTILFTANGLALGTEVSVVFPDHFLIGSGELIAHAEVISRASIAAALAAARAGHYRPTNWPSVKPFKYS